MLKKNLFFLSLIVSASFVKAQVGINTNTPNPSTILDIKSDNLGVLVPRVALTSSIDTSTILNASSGKYPNSLLVYNTNTSTGVNPVSPGFYYWQNNQWTRIADTASTTQPWLVQGTTNPATSNTNNIYQTGSVAIGKSQVTAGAKFDVVGSIRGGVAATGTPSPTIGANSLAVGNQAFAGGDGSSAFGYKSSASGLNSFAGGGGSDSDNKAGGIASGDNAFAFGRGTQATKNSSFAFGQGAIANGDYSFAFGANGTQAGSNFGISNAFAFGDNAKTSTSYSFAFGQSVSANAGYSFAFGNNNTNAGGSNSFAFGSAATNDTPYTFAFGNAVRNKAANNSFAFGENTNNIGAGGTNAIFSLAFGNTVTNKYAEYALAFGNSSNNTGTGSTASSYSLAFGQNARNSGIPYSFAFGNNALNQTTGSTSGSYSFAFGNNVQNSQSPNYAFAFGNTIANTAKNNTFAAGSNLNLKTDNQVAFGSYNENVTNAAFEVANGTAAAKKNLITLLNTGNLGIGTSAPASTLDVNGNIKASGTVTANGTVLTSDLRYKKDLQKLQSILPLLDQLNAYTYFFKTDEFKDKNFSDKKQIGMIAQEVEKVFPELVSTDAKGYKSLNYAQFTAVLLEAVKELNSEVSALKIRQTNTEQQIISIQQQIVNLKQ